MRHRTHRRSRRLITITAVSGLVVIGAGGLASAGQGSSHVVRSPGVSRHHDDTSSSIDDHGDDATSTSFDDHGVDPVDQLQ